MVFRVRTEFNQPSGGGSGPNPFSPAIPLTPGPFGLDLVPRPPAPVASPPVIAAPPAPPPVAPPPVVVAPPAPPPIAPPPPVAETPVVPAPPIAQADPIAPTNPVVAPADPVVAAANPVVTDPAPANVPVDAPPADPFNPPTDAGNQNAQASAGNDPVMNAATFAPTMPGDIFNTGAQNPPDNNPAPDANQGGDATLFKEVSLSTNQGVDPNSDLNSVQQTLQPNVSQPEAPAVTNTDFVKSDNSSPAPETNPAPEVNVPQEVGRAVLSAVPVVGPVVSAGEAIAGQTITGRELSTPERVALGVSAALGAIPIAQGAKAALSVGEAGLAAKAATAAGEALSSNAFGAQVSGAVTRTFDTATADQTDPQALDNIEQKSLAAQVTGVGTGAAENPALKAVISGAGNAFQQNIGDTAPPDGLQDTANFAIGAASGLLPDAARAGAGQLAEQVVANADNVGLPLASEVGNAVEKAVTESAKPATEFVSNVPTNSVNDATAEGSQIREEVKAKVDDVGMQVQSDFNNLVDPLPVAP